MRTSDVRGPAQFKNILFTTDFSPAAGAAVPFAAKLARQYGAKLYALYVRPPVVNPMTPPISWKDLEESAEIEDEQHKKDLLNAFKGMEPEILIKEGDLWSNLEPILSDKQIDLIVMGTRGRSGIGKLVLGSTAEEILRQVSCPVLTVGPKAIESKKRPGEISRILFATDFGPGSNAAASYAVSLAQKGQAHLTLLHVIEDPKTGELVRATELIASSTQMLRKLMPADTSPSCVPECVVEQGDPAEKILEVAARCQAELIVLGVRRPSGVPGAAVHLPIAVMHKVVSHAACPALTVRG